jgi:hypothetical protein
MVAYKGTAVRYSMQDCSPGDFYRVVTTFFVWVAICVLRIKGP